MRNLKKNAGFTLIELVMFIIVTGILAAALLLALSMGLVKTPNQQQAIIATNTARQCMEWIVGQRRLNGYSTYTCGASTTPSFCTAPSGYTVSASFACTTISGDSNYDTVTVTVGGKGRATLKQLLASY
jgi:type II secretory pathway pseudopilin PulG